MALADEKLGDATKASAPEIAQLTNQLNGWNIINDGMDKLEREYVFPSFKDALTFVNKIGAVAEEQGHHPQITFTWGTATVRWWSHSLGGLTRNDFIMAAKTDLSV